MVLIAISICKFISLSVNLRNKMNYYLLNVFLCLFGCNLAKDNFFPHGKSNGDEVLVDLSKGIGVKENSNGLFIINNTHHIPFFSIKSNTRIQVLNI